MHGPVKGVAPMMLALFVAAAVHVLPGVAGPAAAAMGPVQYWMAGTRYAENKLYIDAIANFTQAIRTNKGEISVEDIARVFNSRGLAYQELDEQEKAIDDFSNAMRLDDRNPDFILNRGRLYLRMKQYDRSQEDFSAILALDRRNAAAYAGRGRVLLETGVFDQAATDYEKALSVDPRNLSSLFDLGMAYRGDRKNEKALEAFDRLLAVDPKHAQAAYQKAGIFTRERKIDAACIWLGIAVQGGFSDWSALRNDPDFDALRSVGCYRNILSGK